MTETKSKRERPSFFGIFAGTFEVGGKNAKVIQISGIWLGLTFSLEKATKKSTLQQNPLDSPYTHARDFDCQKPHEHANFIRIYRQKAF